MDLRRCRLTEKQQDRLAEFFVAGVTARTAADLLGVNRKTAAYFYHRLRQIIAQEVDRASPLPGSLKSMKAISAVIEKANEGAVPQEKYQSLAYSSAADASTRP